jgi:2-dehydropantoate 2-reductase
MRLLVVGAGATGGYFGGRLALAGRDVSFLVRPARAAALREQGLTIVGPSGEAVLTPKLVAAGEVRDPADIVLVTVKAYSLDSALEDMASQVGPATLIVPVLNGWRHVEVIARRFGAASVIGGLCRISATIDAQGRIRQMTPLDDLWYGELDGSSSGRLAALDEFMQGAGFAAKLSPTIDADMWEKWVLLASTGAANCLMRGTLGEISSQPGGARFLKDVLGEAVAIASAAGRPPRADFLTWCHELLLAPRSPFTTSMYRDLIGGHPIEAQEIIGDLIERGTALGVPTPLLELAFMQLAIHQVRPARR